MAANAPIPSCNISQHLAILGKMLQFPNIPEVKTTALAKSLQQIDVLSQALQHIPLQEPAKIKIFHQQLLKSALFSARIEGNSLTLVAANQENFNQSKSKQKQEISNVLQALNFIQSLEKITLAGLCQIHQKIMRDLSADAGKLRSEGSAIFDQFGNVVYLTPEPKEMKEMMATWLKQAQVSTKKSWQAQLLKIACCHYYFEKIHPFLDGNGRTGRVALQWQLQKLGLFGDFILPIDQFFDDKRSSYYNFLEKNTRNIDNFVEFFLEGVSWALEKLLEDIKNSDKAEAAEQKQESHLNNLLPRRREIYLIIADHPYISLDMIARRFLEIPRRTLAYDLQQLIKAKLVVKQGTTRGVVYTVTNQL